MGDLLLELLGMEQNGAEVVGAEEASERRKPRSGEDLEEVRNLMDFGEEL